MSRRLLAEIEKVAREARANLDSFDERWRELREFNQNQMGVKEKMWEEARREQMRGKKHAVRTATLELLDFKHVCDSKQKIESELGGTLRRLHRYKQQLTEWLGLPELRTQSDEIRDLRKQIELRYKRGRVFYCQGQSSEDSPDTINLTDEAAEQIEWIQVFVEKLRDQCSIWEEEIQTSAKQLEERSGKSIGDVRSPKTRGKSTSPERSQKEADWHTRKGQLEAFVELHATHIECLERITRAIHKRGYQIPDNHAEEIREILAEYINNNNELSIVVAEEIYQELELPSDVSDVSYEKLSNDEAKEDSESDVDAPSGDDQGERLSQQCSHPELTPNQSFTGKLSPITPTSEVAAKTAVNQTHQPSASSPVPIAGSSDVMVRLNLDGGVDDGNTTKKCEENMSALGQSKSVAQQHLARPIEDLSSKKGLTSRESNGVWLSPRHDECTGKASEDDTIEELSTRGKPEDVDHYKEDESKFWKIDQLQSIESVDICAVNWSFQRQGPENKCPPKTLDVKASDVLFILRVTDNGWAYAYQSRPETSKECLTPRGTHLTSTAIRVLPSGWIPDVVRRSRRPTFDESPTAGALIEDIGVGEGGIFSIGDGRPSLMERLRQMDAGDAQASALSKTYEWTLDAIFAQIQPETVRIVEWDWSPTELLHETISYDTRLLNVRTGERVWILRVSSDRRWAEVHRMPGLDTEDEDLGEEHGWIPTSQFISPDQLVGYILTYDDFVVASSGSVLRPSKSHHHNQINNNNTTMHCACHHQSSNSIASVRVKRRGALRHSSSEGLSGPDSNKVYPQTTLKGLVR